MAQKLTAKQEASLRIDYVPLDEIARFDKNPKKHDVGALVTSIRRYGFRDAPIFDGTLKALVAGHGRLKALESMKGEGDKPPAGIIEHSAGQWLVPVQMGVDSKSAAEAKAFLIDHNTLTLSGGDLGVDSMLRLYDQAGLEELLRESGPTVSFDGEDIDELINGKKEVVEDDPSGLIDAAKELEKKWGTKLGQLWILGDHRVLCGDSTKAEDVGRVFGDSKPAVCMTDPPYGLGDSATKKNNYAKHEDTPENLKGLIASAIVPLIGEMRVVLTPGNGNQHKYPEPTWILAWFTPAGVGRGPWGFCCWQPILCYGKDPRLASGNGCHPDALVMTESSSSDLHPCAKPIGVWSWLMERVSDSGDLVFDPFLGSGTTLITAEQVKRKCCGIEITPQYVAVILERWSKATGKEPRLEG